MRLSRLSVSNFRGVREFAITDASSLPIAVLTGSNGAGKSSILEILAFVGRASGLGKNVIGPYGSHAEVEASFTLNDREFEILDMECRDKLGRPAEKKGEYSRRAIIGEGKNRQISGSEELEVAFSPEFRASHPFSVMTLIDSTQIFQLKNSPRISLGAPFNPQATVKSHSGWNHPAVDTEGYLASLDYESMLANREGAGGEDAFAGISEQFRKVTGRILLRPSSKRTTGSSYISVALPNGHHHGLEGLSSGQRVALGLLCLGHYLKTTGGIVLLDEPEAHLHASLHVPLLNAFRDLTSSSQAVMVTHSREIVAALPPRCIIEVHRDSGKGNQAHRPSAPYGVSAAVGHGAADDMLMDFQLVVEGKYDEDDLLSLFPDEISHARIVKAGNSHEVMGHHRSLAASLNRLPWLCLRDRDLMPKEETQRLSSEYSNLHIWPRRAIESMLLHPPLISSVFLTTVGYKILEGEVEELLRELADPLMGEVAETLAHAEINRMHPQPRRTDFSSVPELNRASARVHENRASAWEEVVATQRDLVQDRWEEEWLDLVDPKILLRSLQGKTKVFGRHQFLKKALMTRAGQDQQVRPPGVEEFRIKLERLRASV
ncbi:AAA family ATPase [Streptomyces sp. DG2A-72]|uniref:ATP-dependent nuclease n=1 Tax=Streptomyces sp. DG2A-72 TaxID=3051386 RepID=UPI00265B7F6E|nr:ATP-binding protein [Streptomyces sp. DG2A-72]MDO0935233.1 AAA family ATPase [Streptomyces sp. DG2A-72]